MLQIIIFFGERREHGARGFMAAGIPAAAMANRGVFLTSRRINITGLLMDKRCVVERSSLTIVMAILIYR